MNPFLLWFELAAKTMEMLFASGQVIGTRLDRMARAGHNPSARDRKEFALMGSEKLKAATEASLAMATSMQAVNYQLMTRAWQQWFNAMPAVSLAALKPVHGAATANARRLSRVKRRTSR